jgi:hypothetical protein
MLQFQPCNHQADADTDWKLLAKMAISVDQSFVTVNGEVEHFDSLDVCDRCRSTPWLDGPLCKLLFVWRDSPSATCPVCSVILN